MEADQLTRFHPHSLFMQFGTLFPDKRVYLGAGEWKPISYKWDKVHGKAPTLKANRPSSEEFLAISERFQKEFPEITLDMLRLAVYSYPTGLECVIDSRIVKLHPGDDVKVNYREEKLDHPSYATIDKFLQVALQGRTWLLWFPTWYYTITHHGNIVRHPTRTTIQIERKQMDEDDFMQPFFVLDILNQVMVLHDCVRVCKCAHKKCNCKNICRLANEGDGVKDVHAIGNRKFNVYEMEHGFRPEFSLSD